MLFLKKANYEDIEEEYTFITKTPYLEKGYLNVYANRTKEEFLNKDLKFLIEQSNPATAVNYANPMTTYFLWYDKNIIGIFHVIHKLTDFQKDHDGHISYSILKEYRGNGYATKGLSLVIKEAKNYIYEDEIYMHTNTDNPASLKVMLNNGAIIYKETDKDYFTKIIIK